MLAKMVLHACIMLATHTYRKVRCGSQLPIVGSLLQRGPIGPSSTCRIGVWTCSTYCIVSREVVANVVTFLTVCGSPSDSEVRPIGEGVPVSGTASLGPGSILPTATLHRRAQDFPRSQLHKPGGLRAAERT